MMGVGQDICYSVSGLRGIICMENWTTAPVSTPATPVLMDTMAAQVNCHCWAISHSLYFFYMYDQSNEFKLFKWVSNYNCKRFWSLVNINVTLVNRSQDRICPLDMTPPERTSGDANMTFNHQLSPSSEFIIQPTNRFTPVNRAQNRLCPINITPPERTSGDANKNTTCPSTISYHHILRLSFNTLVGSILSTEHKTDYVQSTWHLPRERLVTQTRTQHHFPLPWVIIICQPIPSLSLNTRLTLVNRAQGRLCRIEMSSTKRF